MTKIFCFFQLLLFSCFSVKADFKERFIEDLAANYKIVFFRASSCYACQLIEPILIEFLSKYNFKIEAIGLDGNESQYFPNRKDYSLADKLQVEGSPSLFLENRETREIIEFIVGYVDNIELEKRAKLITYKLGL